MCRDSFAGEKEVKFTSVRVHVRVCVLLVCALSHSPHSPNH